MTTTIKRPFMRPLILAAVLLTGSTLAQAESPWKDGEQVYAKVCGHCHEKGIGPVIKGRQLPPAYITAIVRHGFRAMPALRSSFIDDQALLSVAEFINQSPATGEE
ncbi:c-type cytochrome [Marinobacterium sp. YM272]|uniref:c-type cytochrome n=1 Tax=Marinobacterium sp. YM272 TaxID=3421654 RepID=UPI003D7F5DF5